MEMTDKMREEFEAEFSKVSNRLLNKYKTQNDNEKYIDNFVEAAFIGFKLSRESMRAIKLPEFTDTIYCVKGALTIDNLIIRNKAIKECKDTITSAGYKVE